VGQGAPQKYRKLRIVCSFGRDSTLDYLTIIFLLDPSWNNFANNDQGAVKGMIIDAFGTQ
jgi:hypothetical protein